MSVTAKGIRWRLFTLTTSIAALGGCASVESLPGACTTDGDCIRGQVCVDAVCVREGGPTPGDGGELDMLMVSVDRSMPPPEPDAAPPEPDAAAVVPDGGECIPNTTRLCDGMTIGLCRRGMAVCQQDGTYGPCEGAVDPTDEQCNRADDDCDGQVDEDLGLGAPCEGVGACGEGVLECRNAREQRCSTDPGGSEDGSREELCDGLDDDCDGTVDENYGAGTPCEGRCGPGVIECSRAGEPVCSTDPEGSEAEGRAEVCDGADNDCDDLVDEGFGLGEACEVPGRCGTGALECDDAGEARCDTAPGGTRSPASPESCNAVDDDCDGVVDEGFDLGAACDGALPCDGGVLECAGNGEVRCSTDPGGSAEMGLERCNSIDDDCDGAVDEGLGLGQPCPAVGACPASELACGAGQRVICATRPGGRDDASSAEVCNAVDDDCDGRTDEGLGLGEPCVGRGECGPGVLECGAEDAVQCSSEGGGSESAAVDEDCNQLDDDCDGRIDESGVCGGEACAGGIALEPGITGLGNTDGLVDDYGRANCLGDAGGPDQVFRFDVPDRGPYVVGVAPLDPAFDPIFWVAGDCPGADREQCLQPDARQTAEGVGRPEAAAINFIRGGRFALVVDGRGAGDRGPYAVTVGPVDAGEDCGTAIDLPVPGRYVSTTARRGADLAARECTGGEATVGPDQVFRIDLPVAARVRFAVNTGVRARAALSVVTDCGRIDETCVGGVVAPAAGDPVDLELDLQAGPAFVIVDHPVQTGGPFVIEATIVE